MTTKTARDPNGEPIVGRSRDPVLASAGYTENGERYTLSVYGGLHYIRGNSAPYFSLTGATWRRAENGRMVEDSGGCIHETILRCFPDLSDLAALHLSDIDGVPMHAAGNGFYHLAGAVPGAFGERYHAGNSKRHFPKAEIDPAKPWATTDYRYPTHAEALQIFADYVRVPLDEAAAIRDQVAAAYDAACDDVPASYACTPETNSREPACTPETNSREPARKAARAPSGKPSPRQCARAGKPRRRPASRRTIWSCTVRAACARRIPGREPQPCRRS